MTSDHEQATRLRTLASRIDALEMHAYRAGAISHDDAPSTQAYTEALQMVRAARAAVTEALRDVLPHLEPRDLDDAFNGRRRAR